MAYPTKRITEILTSQNDRADLRNAAQNGVEASVFALGSCPPRFMEQEQEQDQEQEQGVTLAFCTVGAVERDGRSRNEAFLEHIGEKSMEENNVLREQEMRDRETHIYHIIHFEDGSHLCNCCTLQTLGIPCRHFYTAMLMNDHRLNERARGTPVAHWLKGTEPHRVATETHGQGRGIMSSALRETCAGDERWILFPDHAIKYTMRSVCAT